MGKFENWWAESDQSEHALACALYGDCIIEEVQKGARELEAKWLRIAQNMDRVFAKSVRKGLFGLGGAIVDERWLQRIVYNKSAWPKGLSNDEKAVLDLARMVTRYQPIKPPSDRRTPNEPEPADEKATLEAVRSFIHLFTQKIGDPMLSVWYDLVKKYGRIIKPLCDREYDEPCTQDEAESVFVGDMQRSYKLNTLDVDSNTYHVLLKFWDWANG